MADLEITLKKTNTKLQKLRITRNEYRRILQHLQLVEERLLKKKIQDLKLEQEKNMEEIEKWTSKHEDEV